MKSAPEAGWHPALAETTLSAGEIERPAQVIDGRTVYRDIRIVLPYLRIRKVVAAAIGQRLQSPVLLDELDDRNVIAVFVRHMAALGIGRHNDERDPGAIAEEVNWLDVARIVVAAAFVESDEDCGALPHFRIGLHLVHNLLHEPFKQIQLRRGRMAIVETARLHDGN